MPNRPYQPTDEHRKLVEAMSSVGIQQDVIAEILKIDKKTLRKYFRDELDLASTKANARVAGNLFRQATKDDPRAVTAAIFWLKTRMGWRETVSVEHSGKLELDRMSDDELDRFIEERARRAGSGVLREGLEDISPTMRGKPH